MVTDSRAVKTPLLLDLLLLVGLQALVVLYTRENTPLRDYAQGREVLPAIERPELFSNSHYCGEAENTFSPKDLMLTSAVILASASSSSCVRGRSRWAPLRRRGASCRSCRRRLVFLVCSLVDWRTDFRASEHKTRQKNSHISQNWSSQIFRGDLSGKCSSKRKHARGARWKTHALQNRGILAESFFWAPL